MDEEIKERVFQHLMNIWINPEIERRKLSGEFGNNFLLLRAQVVFSLDNGRNYVRINNEVKAVVTCKINKSKNKGDTVYEGDVGNIEKIELTDEDFNRAHVTLLLFKNNWIVSFDFRYNKKRIQEHIEAAREFFESAKDNLSKKRLRPFFEDAFASAELSAKSILLTLPDKKILEGRDHPARLSKFSSWANLGNVNIEFSNTLFKLNSLRDSARYLHSEDFKKENPEKIVSVLKEMIDLAEKSKS
jgi:uncharacterized protein (UPF0332 family)